MLNEALKYARLGRSIFPCGPDKRPLTANGYKDATTDESLIRAMWGLNPDALIGSPTGSGVVVIDVDGPEGERNLESLEFEHGTLPATRTSRTGEGKHYWFRVPCEIRNSAGKLAPGVDVRGDGGYVILPPSKHQNGNAYAWVRRGETAELPPAWIEAISASASPSSAASVRDTPSATTAGIPKGQRNATLTSLGGTMRRRGMEYDTIRLALHAENKARCKPPLSEREVERIVASISRYQPEPHPAFEPAPRAKLLIKSFSEIAPRRMEWLWPGVFPLGKLSMLVGDPGLGKSLITVDLAARLSTDGRLPDCYGATGDTIFLTAEDDDEDTLRPRLDAAGADVSRVHIIQAAVDEREREKMFNLTSDLSLLDAAIEKTSARLVVVDPVSAYLGGTDANNNAEVRSVLGPLSQVAKRHKCAIIAINHLRKSGGPAVHRVAMSMAFAAHARAVWGVGRAKDGARMFAPIKANLGNDATGRCYALKDADGVPIIEWGGLRPVDPADPLNWSSESDDG